MIDIPSQTPTNNDKPVLYLLACDSDIKVTIIGTLLEWLWTDRQSRIKFKKNNNEK